MAWPTPESLLKQLPIEAYESEDVVSKGVTRADVEGYIQEWMYRLRQGSKSEPPETGLGRGVVVRGVRSDALEQLYSAQGQDIPRAVESMRREAYRMLEQYSEETELPGETSYEEQEDSDEGGYVHNFTDGPLFTHEPPYPDHLERGRWRYA